MKLEIAAQIYVRTVERYMKETATTAAPVNEFILPAVANYALDCADAFIVEARKRHLIPEGPDDK